MVAVTPYIIYIGGRAPVFIPLLMLRSFVLVALGSALGGVLRYSLTLFLPAGAGRWPWPTFVANVVGCGLLGLLSGYLLRHADGQSLRLFAVVGLCGGFTTFSTFAHEQWTLLRTPMWPFALAYMALSLVAGLGLLALGFRLGSAI